MMKSTLLGGLLVSILASTTYAQNPWLFRVTSWIDGEQVSYRGHGWAEDGATFLPPYTPEPRSAWWGYATVLDDGVRFRFELNPPETPGFTRTTFVPFPDEWHDPDAPWHWPDTIIFDETVEWTFTSIPPIEMSRHYMVRLDSFGTYLTRWYIDQEDLDVVLSGWGTLQDGQLIDQGDLDGVLSNWGLVMRPPFLPPQVPPFAVGAVPEPATWGILAILLGAWGIRRFT